MATCALGMGINFQNVEYVIHYGPPHSVTEIIQQSGRAGRSGQQAFSIVYARNRQLSQCDKDVKDIMKTESCMRIALYQHFQEDPTSKDPGHLCCTVCREKCKCTGDGCAMALRRLKATLGDLRRLWATLGDLRSQSRPSVNLGNIGISAC